MSWDGVRTAVVRDDIRPWQPADLACLRAVPAAELLDRAVGPLDMLGFMPHEDGHVLTDKPLAMMRAGQMNRVPVIAGFNKTEFDFIARLLPNLSMTPPFLYAATLQLQLAPPLQLTGAEVDQLVGLYPLAEHGNSPAAAYGAMLSDGLISCPTYLGLVAATKNKAPTYLYRFDYDEVSLPGLLPFTTFELGAMHGIEIPFVFDTLDRPPMDGVIGADDHEELDALGASIRRYFTNFAAAGDPNGPDLPAWTELDISSQRTQIIDHVVTSQRVDQGPTSLSERCAFWNQYNETRSLYHIFSR